MSFDFTSLLAGGAGGLLGILGNVANTFLAMKQEKQNHEYELARIPLQLNADIERTKAEVAKVVEQGAGAAFVASQEADKLDGRESPWAANVKAMVRPSCLFLLIVCAIAIYTAGNPTAEIKEYITYNVMSDCSMAIAWYFGARATALVMQGFKSKAGT